MPKKPVRTLFPKKDVEVFNMVHRAQSDPLYHDEDASKMVLLSASALQSAPQFHGTSRRTTEGTGGLRGGGGDDGGGSQREGGTVASRRSGRSGGGGGGDGGGTVRTSRTSKTALTALTSMSTRSVPRLHRVGGILELSEVDNSGMPLDGYDYNRFLAEGGETYMRADGVMMSSGGRSEEHTSELQSR